MFMDSNLENETHCFLKSLVFHRYACRVTLIQCLTVLSDTDQQKKQQNFYGRYRVAY